MVSPAGIVVAEKPMSETVEPLSDYVVLEHYEAESVSPGGIVIPDKARERPWRGRVVAVGPGKRSDKTGQQFAMPVKAGDEVLFYRYAGIDMKIGGKDVKIVQEKDLLAVVKGEGQ